jgi:drug/metabolite transporter (DMT)-like permease
MSALAFGTLGAQTLFAQLSASRGVIFWLMLGGFIWVIGDLFQQYAAKYVGISRGIPLSNTNQLWGLLWGVLVFGELHGRSATTFSQVIGGSLLMILGVAAITLSSASPKESAQWKAAALRESDRYALSAEFVEARMDGRQSAGEAAPSRGLFDWLFVVLATAVFIYFASIARVPDIPVHWTPAIFLSIVSVILLAVCGLRLYRTTGFQ